MSRLYKTKLLSLHEIKVKSSRSVHDDKGQPFVFDFSLYKTLLSQVTQAN